MLDAHPTLHLDVDPTSRTDAVPSAALSRAPFTGSIEIDSSSLLQGQRELCIRHGDECYRLRHTRNDKLILTK